MSRKLEEGYIEFMNGRSIIPIAAHPNLSIQRFMDIHPDFEKSTRIRISKYNPSQRLGDHQELLDITKKFSEEKLDKIRHFFWNVDLGNIFCLKSRDVTSISFVDSKSIMRYHILQLLYSQKISTKTRSQSYAPMAHFLMRHFTQPYHPKTKKSLIAMISSKVKSKFFLTKLSLIGEQHLPNNLIFEAQPYRNRTPQMPMYHINFVPFLRAMGSNRINVMMLDDLRWFSRIIQQQNFPVSLSGSEPEQDGTSVSHPLLAQLIKYIKSILFSKSNELCFKICMFYVIVYTNRLLLNKDRLPEPIFLEFMFKDSPEIHDIFSLLYIDEKHKYHSLESLKETNPRRYRNLEIYAKRFSFIVEQLENIHNGSFDLPISQLICEQKGETPFQQIVLYILNN
jgi:hypothetical protein